MKRSLLTVIEPVDCIPRSENLVDRRSSCLVLLISCFTRLKSLEEDDTMALIDEVAYDSITLQLIIQLMDDCFVTI